MSEVNEPDGGAGNNDARQPRPRRRALRWSAVGVVVVVAAGVGSWFLLQDTAAETDDDTEAGPVATTEVARETIAATRTWEGDLGHGDPFTIVAAAQGTVTRVAEHDTEVERGTELYRIDEQPVAALVGTIPMYRELGIGSSGIDVEQLEKNLDAMGYDGFTVDREYTWATYLAVQEWQDDIGAEVTGTIEPSDLVFIPHTGRVAVEHSGVGTSVSPGNPVLDVTGTDPVVTLTADIADRDLVEVDTDVTVQLPGGDQEAEGTVTSVTAVPAESDGGGSEGSAEESTLDVEVTLAEEVDETLLGGSVDVRVPVEEHEDVLVVPVNALLAIGDGEYGLEVVSEDGSTSIVPVETGLFEAGNVEVEGGGIEEGTVVGVAGR